MEYSYRFRRRLTKPPTLPPVYAMQPLPLVVTERVAPTQLDQISASSERR